MTKAEYIKQIATLLGIDENDNTVEFVYDTVEETILNYCHIDEIPSGLKNTVVRMAVDTFRNEQFGDSSNPQTVKSISEGGVSTTFDTASTSDYVSGILKNYKKQLNRYRKLVW